MAQSVSLWGATYSDVPAIEVPKSGGGMASFTDVTDTTAIASDVLSGKYFYTAAGEKTLGTGTGGGGSVTQDQDGYIVLPSTGGGGGGSTLITKNITLNGTYLASGDNADGYSQVTVNVQGGASVTETQGTYGTEVVVTSGSAPSATQHTIHLEFSDSTDTDINVYYNDSLLGTMITAYEPSTWTYNNKTVYVAELDGVKWYDKTPSGDIPLNTELIDYTKVTNGYGVYSDGSVSAADWMAVSDYTPIDSTMTFTAKGNMWYYIGFYDSSKNNLGNAVYIYDAATSTSGDVGTVILSSSNIPANAAYTRITSIQNPNSSELSLIRTA